MAFIVKHTGGGGDFEPAPQGPHAARCCDVRDLGIIEDSFNGKPKRLHKLLLSWFVAAQREDGKFYMVSKRYTASLGDMANLRKDLESWRGRAFTPAELEGFDLEKLIGVPCFLNVMHNVKQSTTYANVTSIMPLPPPMKDAAPPIPADYVRWKDRPENKPEPPAASEPPPGEPEYYPEEDDGEVPF